MFENQEPSADPDWDTPLDIRLTPADLIHALFATANNVHTGWTSCVDETLVTADLTTLDDQGTLHCRLVEQEFSEEDQEDRVWHDWGVEIRIGQVFVIGHWQILASAPPLDWEWCAREAERAFDKACLLLGRRTRRGVVVEEPPPTEQPPRQWRH